MSKKFIIAIISLTIFFNGCTIYRLVRIKKDNSKIIKRDKLKQNVNIKHQRINHKNRNNLKLKTSKNITKKEKYIKRYIKKSRVVRGKIKKFQAEPFSIKSKEKDPELLGPQTTLKNNPLSKL